MGKRVHVESYTHFGAECGSVVDEENEHRSHFQLDDVDCLSCLESVRRYWTRKRDRANERIAAATQRIEAREGER